MNVTLNIVGLTLTGEAELEERFTIALRETTTLGIGVDSGRFVVRRKR